MLETGAKLPNVAAQDDSGETVALGDLDLPLVLYFYPKADTPGCTMEAQQFRDLYDRFADRGVEVIGVSRDSVDAQRAFKEKYDLPFRLLADVDSKICDAFGVIVERERDGKKSLGVARATFLIGEGGEVEKVWPAVSVDGHGEEVLSACSL